MISGSILFTDQEMIPSGNEIDLHTWDFVVYHKLLLPILRAFVQCTQLLRSVSWTVVCRWLSVGIRAGDTNSQIFLLTVQWVL